MNPPNAEESLQDLRERFIEHSTQVNGWFGEQWRHNEATDTRLKEAEDFMQEMGKFQVKVGMTALLGSVIGGGIMTIIIALIVYKLTGMPR